MNTCNSLCKTVWQRSKLSSFEEQMLHPGLAVTWSKHRKTFCMSTRLKFSHDKWRVSKTCLTIIPLTILSSVSASYRGVETILQSIAISWPCTFLNKECSEINYCIWKVSFGNLTFLKSKIDSVLYQDFVGPKPRKQSLILE